MARANSSGSTSSPRSRPGQPLCSLRSRACGSRSSLRSPPPRGSRPATLPPGTLLRRFDGAIFRVRQVIADKGFVELEGVREPYSEYKKIDELRFQFAAPE